jgi:CubicO group peptidase (beta-lactamase class C family)
VSASDAIAQIRQALAPLVSDGTLPGYVAAVSMHGESALCADGTLAIGDPRPMSAGTSFRVASLSKLVGAALTLTLVADGAVTLDAAVARWLPELAEPRVLRRPTARCRIRWPRTGRSWARTCSS